ncbi:MAG: hypothetical protein ACRDH9_11090, partial [Actinomycetota bacterium]
VELFLASTLPYALTLIGYNVALGGLVLLVGLTLIRREVRRRGEMLATSLITGTVARALWRAMLVGLAVWIVSAIGTQIFPFDPFEQEPSTASRVVTAVESLSFRVWVAALAIWWGRRLLRRQPPEAQQVDG